MKRWQADALLLGVAVVWGVTFVVQSAAMGHIGPLAFTGLRFLVGAAVVAPLAWRELAQLSRRGRRHDRGEMLRVAGLGVLLCLGAVWQQFGVMNTTVTSAGFLTALYVPAVPILAWALMRQTAGVMVWLSVAACLAGTWLLSGAGRVSMNVGDAWILASVLPWALHVLWVGQVARRLGAPFAVACGQFIVCGLVSLAWALASEPLTAPMMLAAAPAIAFAGVLSVGFGFTMQVVAQRHTHAADAAILLSSETLFAALAGYAFLGDRLGATAWAGAALIFAGILALQLWPLLRAQPARA
jgi:drug/metabolite transporter (DMT)-like permease